jgi:hypothetical protein
MLIMTMSHNAMPQIEILSNDIGTPFVVRHKKAPKIPRL